MTSLLERLVPTVTTERALQVGVVAANMVAAHYLPRLIRAEYVAEWVGALECALEQDAPEHALSKWAQHIERNAVALAPAGLDSIDFDHYDKSGIALSVTDRLMADPLSDPQNLV